MNCSGLTFFGAVVVRVGCGVGRPVVGGGGNDVVVATGTEGVEYVGALVATGRVTVTSSSSLPWAILSAMMTAAAPDAASRPRTRTATPRDFLGGCGGIGPQLYCGLVGGGP